MKKDKPEEANETYSSLVKEIMTDWAKHYWCEDSLRPDGRPSAVNSITSKDLADRIEAIAMNGRRDKVKTDAYTQEEAEKMRDALYDIWMVLQHEMDTSPALLTSYEKAIHARCVHVLKDIKYLRP